MSNDNSDAERVALRLRALAETLLDAAAAIRTAGSDDAVRARLARVIRFVRAWVEVTDLDAQIRAGADDVPARVPAEASAAAPETGAINGAPGQPKVRTAGDGRIVVTAIDPAAGVDLRATAPRAAAWLAARGVRVQTHQYLPPEEERRQTRLALLLAKDLTAEETARAAAAGALLDTIRRALNRTPTLAERVKARCDDEGLTVDAAAAAIGIPATDVARYLAKGRGLTPEQRKALRAWADAAGEWRHSGESLHAAKRVDEIAAVAGVAVAEAEALIGNLIATWAPPLRAARFLDDLRLLRRPDGVLGDMPIVHAWVSPDPPAERFFTGGWLLLKLVDLLRGLAPQAEIVTDLRLIAPDGAVFAVPILVGASAQAALIVEPMTARNPTQQQERLRRLRALAPLLTDGDPRRLVVVRAVPGEAALDVDAAMLASLAKQFGVTMTTLDAAAASLRAAWEALADVPSPVSG